MDGVFVKVHVVSPQRPTKDNGKVTTLPPFSILLCHSQDNRITWQAVFLIFETVSGVDAIAGLKTCSPPVQSVATELF